MKVLYHIDSESKWNTVLENVKNMLKYGAENGAPFEIEVVANGIAIVGLLQPVAEKSKWYPEMAELSEKKVVFAACHNALSKFNPTEVPVCAFVKVVPAGVVEIAQKQEEGYSYIKP